jgi:hypothetical protein
LLVTSKSSQVIIKLTLVKRSIEWTIWIVPQCEKPITLCHHSSWLPNLVQFYKKCLQPCLWIQKKSQPKWGVQIDVYFVHIFLANFNKYYVITHENIFTLCKLHQAIHKFQHNKIHGKLRIMSMSHKFNKLPWLIL